MIAMQETKSAKAIAQPIEKSMCEYFVELSTAALRSVALYQITGPTTSKSIVLRKYKAHMKISRTLAQQMKPFFLPAYRCSS